MAGLRSAKTTATLFIRIFLYIKLQIILPISVQLEHFIVHNNKIMVLTLVLCFHYDIWKQLCTYQCKPRGGGECGQGVGIWQILKFFDQIPQGGKRKVNQKCQKKPPPQGKKSKQTML